jgi:hypothetical protein
LPFKLTVGDLGEFIIDDRNALFTSVDDAEPLFGVPSPSPGIDNLPNWICAALPGVPLPLGFRTAGDPFDPDPEPGVMNCR